MQRNRALFFRITRLIGATLVASTIPFALLGCGGGKSATDSLLTLRPGQTWTYSVTGTVTLPAAQGGGSQDLQANSVLTYKIGSATVKDANNVDTNVLDRNFDLFLLDGREIKANFRLYFTQSTLGVFVHGVNNYVGATAVSTNDRFVPGTANPAFSFLYLPNPFADGKSITYSNPLSLTGSTAPADPSYSLLIGSGFQGIHVTGGDYRVKAVNIAENFNNKFVLTNAGIDPAAGLIVGTLNATLPDGTKISGTISLTSLSL